MKKARKCRKCGAIGHDVRTCVDAVPTTANSLSSQFDPLHQQPCKYGSVLCTCNPCQRRYLYLKNSEELVIYIKNISTGRNKPKKIISKIKTRSKTKKCRKCGGIDHDARRCVHAVPTTSNSIGSDNTIPNSSSHTPDDDQIDNDDTVADSSLYANDLNESVPVLDQHLICQFCHRSSNETHSIHIQTILYIPKARKYGDRASTGDKLCGPCYKYKNPETKSVSWGILWPAVIFTLLTARELIVSPQDVLGVLPITIRSMFNPCIPMLNPSFLADWYSDQHYLWMLLYVEKNSWIR